MKVSVIVPIYNVAAYIERCAESLMQQTLQDVEYIFIDDCSPDNSIQVLRSVLDKYNTRQFQIKILSHLQNLGLPAARNTGLKVANGKYIYHCDSDDYLDKNLLQSLYTTAEKECADYVWCDYFVCKAENTSHLRQCDFISVHSALQGALQGKIVYNVWNKLVKRELYTAHNIQFPSGYSMGEDMTMLMLLARAHKVAYVPQPLYYYVRSNTGALTRQGLRTTHINALHYNLSRIVADIEHLYGDEMKDALAALQLQAKWQFLICGEREKYDLWHTWFPELHSYIWKYRHTQSNFRIKLIEWFAAKGQYWLVWLHYQIVIRCYTNWWKANRKSKH